MKTANTANTLFSKQDQLLFLGDCISFLVNNQALVVHSDLFSILALLVKMPAKYLPDQNDLLLSVKSYQRGVSHQLKAKILNDGKEYYVRAQDIVCIKAGAEHDILEIYGEEDFELFWLYEPGPEDGRLGHLHRSPEKAQEHPVPAKPIPPGFPT